MGPESLIADVREIQYFGSELDVRVIIMPLLPVSAGHFPGYCHDCAETPS